MGFFDDLFGSSSSFNTSKSSRCFYENLAGKCGSCVYMNPSNSTGGMFSGSKYKCTKRGSYYPWNDRKCSSIVEIDPERVDCCERYRQFTGRRYFILTAICEILGIDENNRLFNEIKTLTDLVRDDETTTIDAISYDIYGPVIANQLRNDKDNVNICNFLLENYLIKVYCLIELNKTDEAIETYKDMVKYLYFRYRNINNYAEMIDAKNFENPKVLVMKPINN